VGETGHRLLPVLCVPALLGGVTLSTLSALSPPQLVVCVVCGLSALSGAGLLCLLACLAPPAPRWARACALHVLLLAVSLTAQGVVMAVIVIGVGEGKGEAEGEGGNISTLGIAVVRVALSVLNALLSLSITPLLITPPTGRDSTTGMRGVLTVTLVPLCFVLGLCLGPLCLSLLPPPLYASLELGLTCLACLGLVALSMCAARVRVSPLRGGARRGGPYQLQERGEGEEKGVGEDAYPRDTHAIAMQAVNGRGEDGNHSSGAATSETKLNRIEPRG
jgi:hypothetical protein